MTNIETPAQAGHTQTCRYCKVVTHKCGDPKCKELRVSVCPKDICQAKLLIEHYQQEVESLKDLLKDKDETLRSKGQELREAIQLIDHYRLTLMQPDAMQTLVSQNKIDSTTMRIYAARMRPFWSSMDQDAISEWSEIHHTIYTTLLEMLHTKGLKLQIKKHLLTQTADAVSKGQPTVVKPKVKVSTASAVPEWAKTPEGKAVYGYMKTYKCTKEEAEAIITKYNKE